MTLSYINIFRSNKQKKLHEFIYEVCIGFYCFDQKENSLFKIVLWAEYLTIVINKPQTTIEQGKLINYQSFNIMNVKFIS